MYTQEEVKTLCQLFEEWRIAEEKLTSFCSTVAKALDFDEANTVGIMDDEVFFTAEWYGPYQSHDSESFYFPASMLTQGEEVVVNYLKQLRKEKQDKEHQERQEQREREEKQLLKTLKEKYENAL